MRLHVPLRTQLLVAVAAPAVALLVILSGVVFLRVRAERMSDLDESLAARAAALASLVERDAEAWEIELPPGSRAAPGVLGSAVAWRVQAFPDGPVLAEGAGVTSWNAAPSLPPGVSIPQDRPTLLTGSASLGAGAAGRPLRIWSGLYGVRSELVEDDGAGADHDRRANQVLAIVRIDLAADPTPVYAQLHALVATLAATGLALAALALGVGWLLSRRIVDPIERIARLAEGVRDPPKIPPLPERGTGDELDRLARSLNDAFARLRDSWLTQARFTADASHELRTPLAVILTQAEVALRGERSPEQLRSALAEVIDAATRTQDILAALLLLARGDAGAQAAPEAQVDLSALARDVATGWWPGPPGPAVEVGAPECVVVSGDDHQLRLLLDNLLSNALRHTPADGTVHVAVAREGSEAVLVVSDNGEGVPPDALPHLFERFFRVDEGRSRGRGGAGLGLSIVLAVARRHGGTASVRSALGEGTRVEVRLPCVAS